MWLRVTSAKEKSLKLLIHILYMICPSIERVSKGRFDAFMGWQFCLRRRYCCTSSPTIPIILDCCANAARSTGSKFNQSSIRRDVTSARTFPIGLRWHGQPRLQAHLYLNTLDFHSGCWCQDDQGHFSVRDQLRLSALSKLITAERVELDESISLRF